MVVARCAPKLSTFTKHILYHWKAGVMALREELSMADICIRVKQGHSEKFRILGIHFSIHDLFDTQEKEVKQWVKCKRGRSPEGGSAIHPLISTQRKEI